MFKGVRGVRGLVWGFMQFFSGLGWGFRKMVGERK
jgi:hypothetical protein